MAVKKQISIVLTVMLFCTVLINPFVNVSEFKANAAEPLEEVKISGFETDEEVWQFGLGDGVGAQGSFVRDDSEFFEGDYSGKLSGNFGAGGSFVVLKIRYGMILFNE